MLNLVKMSVFSHESTRLRSVSFPARSHPDVNNVQENLSKLILSWDTSSSLSSDTICNAVVYLSDTYKSISDLLALQLSKKLMENQDHEKCLNVMLDGLIKYLDISSRTREAVLSAKESVRELQSALRRSKGGVELSIDSHIDAYFSSRKRMRKEVGNCLASLKQMANKFDEDEHNQSSPITRILKESNLITVSIMTSLLAFLSVHMVKPKPSKWSLVSRLMHKGKVLSFEADEQDMNELDCADFAVSNLLENNSELAQKRLEDLDLVFEEIENELECLFRRLIQVRVSLLNILSQ